jgi:hypothetical protein
MKRKRLINSERGTQKCPFPEETSKSLLLLEGLTTGLILEILEWITQIRDLQRVIMTCKSFQQILLQGGQEILENSIIWTYYHQKEYVFVPQGMKKRDAYIHNIELRRQKQAIEGKLSLLLVESKSHITSSSELMEKKKKEDDDDIYIHQIWEQDCKAKIPNKTEIKRKLRLRLEVDKSYLQDIWRTVGKVGQCTKQNDHFKRCCLCCGQLCCYKITKKILYSKDTTLNNTGFYRCKECKECVHQKNDLGLELAQCDREFDLSWKRGKSFQDHANWEGTYKIQIRCTECGRESCQKLEVLCVKCQEIICWKCKPQTKRQKDDKFCCQNCTTEKSQIKDGSKN